MRSLVRRFLMPLVVCLALTALSASPAAHAHKLTYKTARKAAQRKADQFAGQRTQIDSLLRFSRHRYRASADWERTDPNGCKGCGYDPSTGESYDTPTVEYCNATIIVHYRTHRSIRPTARVDEHACF
jgi:hypothetical protein